jgi:hypothetical protein
MVMVMIMARDNSNFEVVEEYVDESEKIFYEDEEDKINSDRNCSDMNQKTYFSFSLSLFP